MAKKMKYFLIVSLLLNVAFIFGFWSFLLYARYTTFHLQALNFRAALNSQKSILSDLESEDLDKIPALKQRLQKSIQVIEKNANLFQAVADKAASHPLMYNFAKHHCPNYERARRFEQND